MNATDGNPSTKWHTQWYAANPAHPHTITLNLNNTYAVRGFRYLPRQDGYPNGTIGQYRFESSMDNVTWTTFQSGTLGSDTTQKDMISQRSQQARYIRLVALSEINGNPWTSVAGLNIFGTLAGTPTPTPTPTSCHLYTPTSSIPAGFGSPYDVVSSPNTNLIQTTCTTNPVAVTLGKADPLRYIYNTGYLYKQGLTTWQTVNYTSTESLTAGAWYPKTATTNITMTATELAKTSYVLGYLCTWTGSTWKCGCRGSACTQSYWQIQNFKRYNLLRKEKTPAIRTRVFLCDLRG